ncbi:hypothetical protein EW146_g2570 [Bondarzewia mesenterica]|uniref:FMR1-interacting protein 1 conserved domain-containing protein n=1 Tax=Bondarzewia mesenterica TaxID=1095465 RepID=A0A4S4M071_9AGAM|nr:hypothetical protein EW146_g2570 [Bondarzewia mesenterica]
MQPQGNHGLPPRPSFSHNVHYPQNAAPASRPQTAGAIAAQALTSALANPYAQYQSPHYAQAYAQYYAAGHQGAGNTGYSSAYTAPTADPSFSAPSTSFDARGRGGAHAGHNRAASQQQPTHWYSSGNSRCTQPGCAFAGSAKAVEIHMMDRHLIYPPGWDKRRRRSDWDADPSLKGKPVLIQGTSISLDTPEALEKWIEERKRRWPTDDRVFAKKKGSWRRLWRADRYILTIRACGRTRGGGSTSLEVRRGTEVGERGAGAEDAVVGEVLTVDEVPTVDGAGAGAEEEDSSSSSDSESDVDGPPEAVSSKAPSGLLESAAHPSSAGDKDGVELESSQDPSVPLVMESAAPPSADTQGTRPCSGSYPLHQAHPETPTSAAETATTQSFWLASITPAKLSNLSQAIHFLVHNDFLENVELKPGDADQKMIEVIGEQPVGPSKVEGEPGATPEQEPRFIPSLH